MYVFLALRSPAKSWSSPSLISGVEQKQPHMFAQGFMQVAEHGPTFLLVSEAGMTPIAKMRHRRSRELR